MWETNSAQITRAIGKHKRTRVQTWLDTVENVCIQALGPVQQHEIESLREIMGQGFQCVSFANLDKIDEARFCEVFASSCRFGRLKLRREDATSTIVSKGRGEIDGRNTK